ncbi:MAG: DNA repair protein RadC [Nannocystaceae bacterium]|nr:DNA repair protein RadC [Nannocystaceae bacterium]
MSTLLPTAPHERPRERLLLFGRETLADVELVALVLGGGRALERALSVLAAVGGLSGLSRATAHELVKIPGVGVAGAASLSAAFVLGQRMVVDQLPLDDAMRGPEDVARFAVARFGPQPQETFAVLGLDARQRVRLVRTVAVGSLAQVDVHPREVFRPLLRAGMHSVLLVHNHPSGEPEPSAADVDLTRRLFQVGELVGIPVVDHIVVAAGRWRSLSLLGLMPDGP